MKFPKLFLASASALIVSVLHGCGGGSDDPPYPPSAPAQTCSVAGLAASQASAFPTACVLTSEGEYVVELYPQAAPATVANFLSYVDAGIYTTTVMHRVVKDFVVQGGGYKWDDTPVITLGTIPLESGNGLKNIRGTMAMARSQAANSAASQFFINVADNSACLDKNSVTCPDKNGYAVFGKVISGMSTIDRINGVPVDSNDWPRSDVVVYWIKRLK